VLGRELVIPVGAVAPLCGGGETVVQSSVMRGLSVSWGAGRQGMKCGGQGGVAKGSIGGALTTIFLH
jgi:hypothetical protein